MFNKKAQVTWIIVIVALLVLGFAVFWSLSNNDSSVSGNVINENGEEIANAEQKNTIEITSSGFSPNEITISKGDTVTWINKDTKERWPASAMHPTHTKYAGGSYDEPGSYAGSQACKAEGEAKTGAFDPCRGLAPGESWSFKFDQIGTWSYHDHLVSGSYGKIIVQ